MNTYIDYIYTYTSIILYLLHIYIYTCFFSSVFLVARTSRRARDMKHVITTHIFQKYFENIHLHAYFVCTHVHTQIYIRYVYAYTHIIFFVSPLPIENYDERDTQKTSTPRIYIYLNNDLTTYDYIYTLCIYIYTYVYIFRCVFTYTRVNLYPTPATYETRQHHWYTHICILL